MLKRKLIITLILIFAVNIFNIASVKAANKAALVIGNSNYKSSSLQSPVNDAVDISAVLERLGFDVILKKNVSKKVMLDAFREFEKKLSSSEIGLFYFAGHGIQINGTNYLIPVNNNIQEESEVEFEAIDVKKILNKMEKAGNPLNIVILDACRDNPFKRSFRTSKKGLAKINANLGTIIAYAASPGSVAADGDGRNRTYTKSLIKNLQTPNFNVQRMFQQTGLDVIKKTNKKQVPWVSKIPFPDYFLAAGKKTSSNQNQPIAPTQPQSIVSTFSVPVKGKAYTESITGMEFMWVEGGCYQMGSHSGESNEKPVHEVCVDGFYMAKHEATQGQWQKIMGSNPSYFKNCGNDCPVEKVSWNDVKQFIEKLNSSSNVEFRLPTEAEWEYAARSGGKDEKYAGGNDVDSVAWYTRNSSGRTHQVCTKSSNGLGIYDMSGNVREWCEDVYNDNAYSKHPRNNPLNTGGRRRVIRGGSWVHKSAIVLSTRRFGHGAGVRDGALGFRLCISQIEE